MNISSEQYVKLRRYQMISDEARNQFSEKPLDPKEIASIRTAAGFRSLLLGYAIYDGEVIAANIIGTRTSVEATIATFHNNRIKNAVGVDSSSYSDPDVLRTNLADRWKVYRAAFDSWGVVNAVLACDRLVNPNHHHENSFVIPKSIENFIGSVYSNVHTAVSFPVKPWWATYMFKRGSDDREISKLHAKGMNVYRVSLKPEYWREVIGEGLRNGFIQWTEEEYRETMAFLELPVTQEGA